MNNFKCKFYEEKIIDGENCFKCKNIKYGVQACKLKDEFCGYFEDCENCDCGAIVSFDNAKANGFNLSATENYNRRVHNEKD